MHMLLYSLGALLLLLPASLSAQGSVYSPLVDLSNAGQGNQVQTFEQYINFLYGMSIAVAALLAVIKIVIAGAKYMLDDVITGKEQAKQDIQGAILGLLIILSAVIILELINPQLVEKKIEFPALQSARGELYALESTTVAGSTASIESETTERLDPGCGVTTRHDTPQFFVWALNASTCSDKGAALGAFARGCAASGGQLATQHAADFISSCAVPKTGIGAGGRQPNQEFSFSGYSVLDVNFCWLGGVLCSETVGLHEQYKNTSASVGATVVYDAMRQCKEELGESWQEEYGPACMETVEDLLFTTCSVSTGVDCNTGWCIHNAGIKVTAGAGQFACRLPYQRFSESDVRDAYNKSATTAQKEASFYGDNEYAVGCRELGGVVADIKLNYTSSNRRCVKR